MTVVTIAAARGDQGVKVHGGTARDPTGEIAPVGRAVQLAGGTTRAARDRPAAPKAHRGSMTAGNASAANRHRRCRK